MLLLLMMMTLVLLLLSSLAADAATLAMLPRAGLQQTLYLMAQVLNMVEGKRVQPLHGVATANAAAAADDDAGGTAAVKPGC